MHHTAYRAAFNKKLIDQPLMRNVLADLALESEAALALTLRLGRAMDESAENEQAAAFVRIVTAVGKYWICKRTPAHCVEALECLGGPGYIEDSIMPRLYREAPLNSIWEGSGNIMCLDVLRAMFRETAAIPAILMELESARGANSLLDSAIDRLATELGDPERPRSAGTAVNRTDRFNAASYAILVAARTSRCFGCVLCYPAWNSLVG